MPTAAKFHLCLLSLIAIAMLIVGCRQSARYDIQPVEKPIEFLDDNAIKNSESVFVPKATVLIGEIHGTWEIPIAVVSMVRDALVRGHSVVLCIELPTNQQPLIDRFLDSDGSESDVQKLLHPSFWSGQDGRSSVGMYAMLELVRRLRKKEYEINVFAIDNDFYVAGESVNRRDRMMAEKFLQIRKSAAESIVVCLAGSVHTNTNKDAAWNKDYEPMGWGVAQSIPDVISLNTTFRSGKAWVITKKGIGPRTMNGKDRGDDPFLQLSDSAKRGFHGSLYLGNITAAKPALIQPDE